MQFMIIFFRYSYFFLILHDKYIYNYEHAIADFIATLIDKRNVDVGYSTVGLLPIPKIC